ncbi:MAG: hypothetical protein U0174_24985 [Polyangiaceae bacterium]
MKATPRRTQHLLFCLATGTALALTAACTQESEGTGTDAGTPSNAPDAIQSVDAALPLPLDPSNDASPDSAPSLLDGGDGGDAARGPVCSPTCANDKACAYSGACVTKSSCAPADVGAACAPGVVGEWIINGNNKINKLENVVLCVHKNVRAEIYDTTHKPVLTIQDIFCKQTNFNSLLGKGTFFIEFYDSQGAFIEVPPHLKEDLELK